VAASIPDSTLEKFATFGDLLRFLRRRAGITQLELSIAVGYSDAQISRLEQNLRPPDIPTIEARFPSALGLEEEPRAVARLLDLAANSRREVAPASGYCPYKGLQYFEEADADLFVGREELTGRLVERLLSLASGSQRFLAVIGASGSGKSSLVRAGVIPAIRGNGKSADWDICILTPGARPVESLAASLTRESPSVAATATLMDDMQRDPRSLGIFVRRIMHARSSAPFLLVVDQFEELFTLSRSDAEQAAFIANLLTATAEPDGRVIILIALRADFYAYCASHMQLRGALAQNQEYIGAMTEDELRRAIEEPAHRGRWEFEPGLVDLLLHDVGNEPGALPLLSHALVETWERRAGRTLTLSGYTSSGGVRGAIAETAEVVFTDRFSPDEQQLARRIFLRLTELGDETATGDTRRRVTLDELILKAEDAKTTHALLRTLADARLVVTNGDSVEVAHEALIRQWPRLRGWLEDNRESLRLHRQLTGSAHEWETLDRDPEILYRGTRLSQARDWAVTHSEEMNALEREFLAASAWRAEHEAAEREKQRQRELEAAHKLAEAQTSFARQLGRRAVYLTGAFVVALLMALVALYFGSQARQTAVTAENERRIATARELAAASLNNLNVDPERSLLLALQSISTTRSVDGAILPESIESLHRALVSSPIRATLSAHGTPVLSAAYSPDGKRLATIGNDGTVQLWDPSSRRELLRIAGTTQPSDVVTIQRVVFSPNGKLLAACDGSEIKLYDPASGSELRALTGHPADVTAIVFSADGRYIASGGVDGSVIIWEAAGGSIHARLAGHTATIEGLAFSPDGQWLVTAGDDDALNLWNVATGDLLHDYSDFTAEVGGPAFSPDGSLLAFTDGTVHVWQLTFTTENGSTTVANREIYNIPGAASETFSPDGTQLAGISGTQIKIWDAATGRELRSLVGHTDWVMGIAYSPDGRSLASTSLDGTAKIWDLGPGDEVLAVRGSVTNYGTRVVYSPDGRLFATNGGDGSATLWDALTGMPRLVLRGHDQEVLSLSFSADGKRLATGSFDTTAIVWDTATGRKLLTLSGHTSAVRDVAFSPDGSHIATASFDGTAAIWDSSTGKQLREIRGHQGLVLGVAFSQDGTRLATSSTDGTAKIWDVETGALLLTLQGHDSGIRDIAYSPDGRRLATGSGDGTAILWDTETGSQLHRLSGHTSGIQSMAFSPDGKRLATGSEDNSAAVWDVATGSELFALPGSAGGVDGVAFSPLDGGARLVVASNDAVVRVFLLRLDDLLTLAQTRLTRSLTTDECRKYLHVEHCPAEP